MQCSIAPFRTLLNDIDNQGISVRCPPPRCFSFLRGTLQRRSEFEIRARREHLHIFNYRRGWLPVIEGMPRGQLDKGIWLLVTAFHMLVALLAMKSIRHYVNDCVHNELASALESADSISVFTGRCYGSKFGHLPGD